MFLWQSCKISFLKLFAFFWRKKFFSADSTFAVLYQWRSSDTSCDKFKRNTMTLGATPSKRHSYTPTPTHPQTLLFFHLSIFLDQTSIAHILSERSFLVRLYASQGFPFFIHASISRHILPRRVPSPLSLYYKPWEISYSSHFGCSHATACFYDIKFKISSNASPFHLPGEIFHATMSLLEFVNS